MAYWRTGEPDFFGVSCTRGYARRDGGEKSRGGMAGSGTMADQTGAGDEVAMVGEDDRAAASTSDASGRTESVQAQRGRSVSHPREPSCAVGSIRTSDEKSGGMSVFDEATDGSRSSSFAANSTGFPEGPDRRRLQPGRPSAVIARRLSPDGRRRPAPASPSAGCGSGLDLPCRRSGCMPTR
jgi:hypothetical protein